MKVCTTCGESKPLDEFYRKKLRSGRYGKTAVCRPCALAKNRAYNAANREAISANKRAYYAENRDRILAHRKANSQAISAQKAAARRLQKYGLTPAAYESLQAEYDGCAICGRADEGLVIDHCHDAGHVRGLLCNKCNAGLGMFRDDPALLIAASQYLQDDSRKGRQS
jgi:hypothetical protein